jgi:hypothetical protein
MLRRPRFLCALLLGLLLHAGAAYGAPGDPEAGSPSGGVYEVPLDAARDDAAPGSGGTTAPGPGGGGQGSGGSGDGGSEEGAGGGGETESSNYRSENNFGSSSEVPGVSDVRVGAGEERAPAATAAGGGDGSAGGEGGGAGSSTDAEPLSAPAEDTGNTSVAGSLALLATIGVLAAALGIFLSRRRRLGTR